jgi:hypothetical protein
MAQDWESAPGFFVATLPVSTPELTAAHALRPLTTGEVLDRTFSVYRSHFWLFAGLACLSGACSLVLNMLQLLAHHMVLVKYGVRIAAQEAQGSGFVVMILLLPVGAVVYAASVFAVCEVYLGRGITAGGALRATMGKWLRYVGIALWQGWSALWLFGLLFVPSLVLITFAGVGGGAAGAVIGGALMILLVIPVGGVYGVIAYIRNSMAIPAALMEGSGVRASMRRSKTLAKGTKGRIFVVLLIAVALYLVAGAIESPMLFIVGRSPLQEHVLAQASILLIGFVSHTLISPVALIGLTLVYFDQRVRHEAFDLLVMLGPEAYPVAPAAMEPVPIEAAPIEPLLEPLPDTPAPVEALPTDEVLPARADDETLP